MMNLVGCAVLALTLMQSAVQQPAPASQQAPAASQQGVAAAPAEGGLDQKLLATKRIYIESFGDDAVSKQIHAMVVSSLAEAKRLVVTENKERADAVLKGTGLEKTSQEAHAYSDSTAAGGSAGYVHGGSGWAHGKVASSAAALEDASLTTETVDRARIAVRLVDRDGDVIWSTTQESKGAKYKGASADVAEKVVKQLLRDLDKAEKRKATVPNP